MLNVLDGAVLDGLVKGMEHLCRVVLCLQIALQRNEVTALINTLSRFSEALASTSEMMSILERIPEDSFKGGKVLTGPVQKSA